ncbi:hypothetical protein MBM_01267 [Drepanopeziza brunnea f. sp. 'multigermtubi' MB_m1]|uniref:MYND-type domain-containing protein n=1 Tax=Marssonina brunnea f. sp. multigermtubi (strain MB_m1) TaxID=1072389 RepID=K1WSK2_MARBU|nr:uncharacterized protein MBM_01267 [Drepanopeziza brunnea f. sp. 'multigermtubi' MB_m1]EKD20585.1 hypothetical protein MBM_01267 [Drepanopeziza brunnea f. sp. 'multigermtubi' MB_m1]
MPPPKQSLKPTATEAMVPIEYVAGVFESNLKAGGKIKLYHFAELAPASLVLPHGNAIPDKEKIKSFMETIVRRNNFEILYRRPWLCTICSKKAKVLIHNASTGQGVPKSPTDTGFMSKIFDTIAPLCGSGGTCQREATQLVQDYSRSGAVHCSGGLSSCHLCGKMEGVKLCSGCMIFGFCSKECQVKAWPTHKHACKQSQKIAEGFKKAAAAKE